MQIGTAKNIYFKVNFINVELSIIMELIKCFFSSLIF